MDTPKKYTVPVVLIGGGLIILALVAGLIGAFRGPSAGALKVQATAVATQESADKAEILAAIQRADGLSDADKQWLQSLVSNDDDFTDADRQTILDAVANAGYTGLNDADKQWLQQVIAAEVAKLQPAATATSTGDPATPAATPKITLGWSNLSNRQAWIDPDSSGGTTHIEFVGTTDDATEAKVGLDNGEATFAFAAMGGNVRGCTVSPTPMRDSLKLNCPVVTVQFAISQDGKVITVTTPTFGEGYLAFGEVAELVRQGEIDNIGLWQPRPGFFLAWVTNPGVTTSGLYVPSVP